MTPEQTKRARGWVLQLLSMSPPGEDDGGRLFMTADLLVPQMKAVGVRLVREEIEKLFIYLEGKKFVEIRRLKSPTAKALFEGAMPISARLTSTGQDIIDGTIEDVGVDLGR
jgi:hypothetical protein